MHYIFNTNVKYSDCDFKGLLSLVGILDLVQNGLSENYELNGIGNYTLKDNYNAMWVFTKNKIVIKRRPHFNEKIKIECQIMEAKGIRCYNLTEIFDAENNLLIYSVLETVPIDKETKRIKKLSQIGFPTEYDTKKDKEIAFDMIPQIKDVIGKREVLLTDIDFSHHTNNVTYVKYIMDTYHLSEMEEKKIKSFQVNYMKESLAEDKLSICKKTENNKDYFIIKKEDAEIFGMMLELEAYKS